MQEELREAGLAASPGSPPPRPLDYAGVRLCYLEPSLRCAVLCCAVLCPCCLLFCTCHIGRVEAFLALQPFMLDALYCLDIFHWLLFRMACDRLYPAGHAGQSHSNSYDQLAEAALLSAERILDSAPANHIKPVILVIVSLGLVVSLKQDIDL